jgi:hypothetical protein
MAALADVTAVTGDLLELTRELRRELDGNATDFRTLACLADGVAERADVLASTFDAIDAALAGVGLDLAATDPANPATAEAAAPEIEPEATPAERRPWFATLLRPARWLGRKLRDAWSIFASRAPSERAEFA